MVWRLFKVVVFSVLVPGSVGLLVPRLLLNSRDSWRIFPTAQESGGAAIVVASGLLYLWCAWDFAVRGFGTPAPIDAPKKLVVGGLYRYTRNPMYLGVAGMILGQALYYGSIAIGVYLALVVGLFHTFVVFYEEPTLRRMFRGEYEEYCQRVPRWLPQRPRT